MGVWIGKTGKESLQRRIEQFDITELDIVTALRAKGILAAYSDTEITGSSSVAAQFYKWVSTYVHA